LGPKEGALPSERRLSEYQKDVFLHAFGHYGLSFQNSQERMTDRDKGGTIYSRELSKSYTMDKSHPTKVVLKSKGICKL
jgi:hypothetical protein